MNFFKRNTIAYIKNLHSSSKHDTAQKSQTGNVFTIWDLVEKIKLNIFNEQRRGKAGSLVSYCNLTRFLHTFFLQTIARKRLAIVIDGL